VSKQGRKGEGNRLKKLGKALAHWKEKRPPRFTPRLNQRAGVRDLQKKKKQEEGKEKKREDHRPKSGKRGGGMGKVLAAPPKGFLERKRGRRGNRLTHKDY